MKYQLFVVNAFSGGVYSGNPAAVVIVPANKDSELDDDQRRNIGRQMNLSETAFVTPIHLDGKEFSTAHAQFGLRWFTPDGTEVPLCGHATLATATALFDELQLTSKELSFETQSGVLRVEKLGVEGGRSKLRMEFPYNIPKPLDECEDPSSQLKNGAEAMAELVNGYLPHGMEVIDMQYNTTTKKLLMRLPDDKKVNDSSLTAEDGSSGSLDVLAKFLPGNLPDQLYSKHPDGIIIRGVIIAVSADPALAVEKKPEFHFQTRYFAPWVGIPEDPVTGSAHTVTAPYMVGVHNDHGTGSGGFLRARQCSARGGNLELAVNDGCNVMLVGSGTVVVRGELDHEV